MKIAVKSTEVKTWGNSLGVRIPKKVAEALKLQNGSQIKLKLDGQKIILEPEDNSFFNLSKDLNLLALVSKITDKNKHSNDDFDDVQVGQEIW